MTNSVVWVDGELIYNSYQESRVLEVVFVRCYIPFTNELYKLLIILEVTTLDRDILIE